MFFHKRVASQGEARTRVKPEDLNPGSVRNSILNDAVQHPLTILPLSVCVPLAALGVVTLSPWVFLGGGVMLLIGAGNFYYKYGVKGEGEAVERTNKLRLAVRQQVVDDFADLMKRCQDAAFVNGATCALQMKVAYTNLLNYLNQHPQSSIDQFRFLAEDTFKQGAANLTLAFDLFEAMKTVDAPQLRKELASKRAQFTMLTSTNGTDARYLAQVEALKASKEQLEGRVALLDKKQKTIDELLAKVSLIETELQSTYLELVELGREDPAQFLQTDGGAVKRLKNTVEAARKVEAQLRGDLDPDQAALEQSYIQAGTRN